MENMVPEMEYILNNVGVKDSRAVMENVRNNTIRFIESEKARLNISYARDYWSYVPMELIDKVRFYYRYEIFLYGYSETPFYIKPN